MHTHVAVHGENAMAAGTPVTAYDYETAPPGLRWSADSEIEDHGRGRVIAFRLDRRRRIKVGTFATRILAMRALAKRTEAVCQD
jgi:hypothetical protein